MNFVLLPESILICLSEVAGPSILTWILNARINGHTAVPTLFGKIQKKERLVRFMPSESIPIAPSPYLWGFLQ